MKLIIQIPCLNESETLHAVLSDLPESIPGIDAIETLVIDDGSTDGTAATALGLGVDHVVRHNRNRGLAAAYATGLDACVRLGADIIVNTDGDHQYAGSDIPRLVSPILAGNADMVIGDRNPGADPRLPLFKRSLQRLGSRVVSYLAGRNIVDAVSGFRAISRHAALRTHLVTGFSYTIETVLQASSKGLAIEFVPTKTNVVLRPSRLFRSVPQFIFRSALTMLRVFFMFKPLTVLSWISFAFAVVGGAPIIRFLFLWFTGESSGHIQSLVLGGALLVMSCLTFMAGMIADLISNNRRLMEDTLERVKRMDSIEHHETSAMRGGA